MRVFVLFEQRSPSTSKPWHVGEFSAQNMEGLPHTTFNLRMNLVAGPFTLEETAKQWIKDHEQT